MDNGLSELLQGIDIEKLKEKAGPLLQALTEQEGEADGKEKEANNVSELASPLLSMLGGEMGGNFDPTVLSKLVSALNDKKIRRLCTAVKCVKTVFE